MSWALRNQFKNTLHDIFKSDPNVFLLLGDIGVYGFKELLEMHPDRAFNFGILEQSMIGAAAGISSEGFFPFLHTIAPFMIERAYEQIKVDLGYHEFNANLVSVGGSYDYSALGCTHHSPADVSLMYNIPGANIFLPGNKIELDHMMRKNYRQGLNYYRLSEESHDFQDLEPGFSKIYGNSNADEALLFVGPSLRFCDFNKMSNSRRSIWYTNMISDKTSFNFPKKIKKCFLVQDFYSGAIEDKILNNNHVHVRTICPPRKFLKTYGSRKDAYTSVGLNSEMIQKALDRG